MTTETETPTWAPVPPDIVLPTGTPVVYYPAVPKDGDKEPLLLALVEGVIIEIKTSKSQSFAVRHVTTMTWWTANYGLDLVLYADTGLLEELEKLKSHASLDWVRLNTQMRVACTVLEDGVPQCWPGVRARITGMARNGEYSVVRAQILTQPAHYLTIPARLLPFILTPIPKED